MMARESKRDAKCPYFVYAHRYDRVIVCEDILANNDNVQHIFRNYKQYDAQMSVYCKHRYWACKYCEALDTIKYGEEE